jgi:hypothetical protein
MGSTKLAMKGSGRSTVTVFEAAVDDGLPTRFLLDA